MPSSCAIRAPGREIRQFRSVALACATLACVALCPGVMVSVARAQGGPASAQPRFGDSTWVAPNVPAEIDTSLEGPRVAPPDHERGWETALRLPFRVAFLPLRLLARGGEIGLAHFGDRFLGPALGSTRPPKAGLTMGPALSIGRVNDIGLGPAFTWRGFPGGNAVLHAEATWSTINRRRFQISERAGVGRSVSLQIQGDYDYKTNRRYYGIGNSTPESNRSYYLLEETAGQAALAFGRSALRQLRLFAGYSALGPRRGSHGTPLLEEKFAPSDVPYFHQATSVYLYGVGGELAALDDAREPSRGVHGRFELGRAVGVGSQDPTYNEWLVEGRGYLPVFSRRRVVAVRGAYSGVDPASGTVMPFYRLAQSDGPLRFAGFASMRFRDRQLMLATVEYRWEVWRHVQAVALYEWGEVAPSFSQFAVAAAHHSYGGGLRLGLSETTNLRFDVARSPDGAHSELHLGAGF